MQGALILISHIHLARGACVKMADALPGVFRAQSADEVAGASVHQDQCGVHGVQVELQAIVIRVGKNTAKTDQQGFAVRMQSDLVWADTRQIKGVHPLVTSLGIVDGDNPFAFAIAAGGCVQPAAVAREHPVADKVFILGSPNALLASAGSGVKDINGPTGAPFEEQNLIATRAIASAVAAGLY